MGAAAVKQSSFADQVPGVARQESATLQRASAKQ
jgi:hypothetical protein